ncbi:MAG: hypothetical protein QRY16_03275 [Enterobacterales bacterium endosymbiont of Blomia tropicalis]|uniref:hypothetical protein n=1 Tax=Mixta mediterraneensis TaxID=2758443 RepID=UPI0025A840A4|nr:hypothetical protein [Mixta mediterraneensis]MDL4912836.1 hypothetical protein [Mixta mediterraneensis]
MKWIDKYKSHLSYIYPEKVSVEKKNNYSNYLKHAINTAGFSPDKIYIVTSKNDNTYEDHILPLIEALKHKGESIVKLYHNNEFYVTKHNNAVKDSLNEIFAMLSYDLSPNNLKAILGN